MMEFINGVGIIPYMKWKMKFMFQNTNQDMTGLLVGDFNPSEKI